jgi:hypothetical protein
MRILAAQRNQTSFCSPIAAADFTWFSNLQKTVARTFLIRICQWGGRSWLGFTTDTDTNSLVLGRSWFLVSVSCTMVAERKTFAIQ